MELEKLTLFDVDWGLSSKLENRLWQPKPIRFTVQLTNGEYRKKPLSPYTSLKYHAAREGSKYGLIFVFSTSGSPIDKNIVVEILPSKIRESLFLGYEFLKIAFPHLNEEKRAFAPNQDALFEGSFGAFS